MVTAQEAKEYILDNHVYVEPVSEIKEKHILESIKACGDSSVRIEDVLAIDPIGSLLAKYRSGLLFTKTKVYQLGKWGRSIAYDDIVDIDGEQLVLKNGTVFNAFSIANAQFVYWIYKSDHPEEAKATEEAKAAKAAQEEAAQQKQPSGGFADVSGMSEKDKLKEMTFAKMIADAANELALCGQVSPETFNMLKQLDDNPGAAYLLGVILDNGLGVPRDREQAEKYLRFSADNGNHYSQAMLGRFYMTGGREYDKNIEDGLKYLKLAVEQEDVDAMYFYGRLLLTGWDGVPQDTVMANYYMEKGKTSSLVPRE